MSQSINENSVVGERSEKTVEECRRISFILNNNGIEMAGYNSYKVNNTNCQDNTSLNNNNNNNSLNVDSVMENNRIVSSSTQNAIGDIPRSNHFQIQNPNPSSLSNQINIYNNLPYASKRYCVKQYNKIDFNEFEQKVEEIV
jgi:hypothetical protein